MLKKCLTLSLVAVAVFGLVRSAAAEMDHRIGVGVHYWKKLGDIELDAIEEDGLGWMITYQLRPESLLKFEFDLEQLPESFGGLDKEVYAPQAYVLIGGTIYGAVGAGVYWSDGEFADNPFYAFRVGLDFALLPFLYADLNLNYRFEKWDELDGEDIDEDTIEAGVAVRIEL